MADTEFEEFRQYLDLLPQHIRSTSRNYTLVHDVAIDEDSSPSPPIENSCDYESEPPFQRSASRTDAVSLVASKETAAPPNVEKSENVVRNEKFVPTFSEIPKLKRDVATNLPEELGDVLGKMAATTTPKNTSAEECKSVFLLHNLKDNVSSPDSEQCDSGNSTGHSPDGFKSLSPQFVRDPFMPPASKNSSNSQLTRLELLEGTHRVLHKFITRHNDELELEIGDPIYVRKEADDLWFEGINLRTGQSGIFPSAYVVDIEYSDFDPNTPQMKRERFLLNYLGSVETLYHKGNSVLCRAIQKIISSQQQPHSCILEVSDRGLRMLDKPKTQKDGGATNGGNTSSLDYFYSLKNVSFCAFHPQDARYMGFITKHPQCDRFACHVFQADDSSRPVAEAIGRAFQRFYQKFIETAYPVEDIYIE